MRQLETVRSFFGVHKIEVTPDGRFRTLRHGMELHGAQRLTTDDGKPVTGKPELSTYYHRESPIAEVIEAVQDKKGGPVSMAVIGLGAGLVACLARPQDKLDYYEIDADVIRIANDPKRFTFIRDCKPDTKIVLGDARLTLAANADARYDVIHVDAFSSDSIPVHLLTREALRVYLSRLNPGGIILTHISNNHLDLTDVVAATAASEGLIVAPLRRGRGSRPRSDDQVLDRDDPGQDQRRFRQPGRLGPAQGAGRPDAVERRLLEPARPADQEAAGRRLAVEPPIQGSSGAAGKGRLRGGRRLSRWGRIRPVKLPRPPMPKFSNKRRVNHSAERMFDLVADVERYPEFVPMCQSLKVRQRTAGADGTETIVGDMTVSFKLIRETFTSRVTLDRPNLQDPGGVSARAVQQHGEPLDVRARAARPPATSRSSSPTSFAAGCWRCSWARCSTPRSSALPERSRSARTRSIRRPAPAA